MSFQVLIPSAGIGSRLFKETKNLNKALVQIDNKPIISHIIEKFPKSCQFIIPVGYKGSDLIDYLRIAHSELDLVVKTIDPFDGDGSGLGYTISQVLNYINKPFVFTSCDTIVKNKIPEPNKNWIGYSKVTNSSDYRTLDIEENKWISLNEKLASDSKNAYIGLAGINDYEKFKSLSIENYDEFFIKGESYSIAQMIKSFEAIEFEWRDTGNVADLNKTRKEFTISSKNKFNVLEKENEKIWFVNNKVIKFSTDKKFIADRVARQKILKDITPTITNTSKHMYSYSFTEGEILSECIDSDIFKKLMKKLDSFWKKFDMDPGQYNAFVNSCNEFYKDKTYLRVEQFISLYPYSDKELILNKNKIEGPFDVLESINWEYLSKGSPTNFHGDLHFENILLTKNEDFLFLDWRQNFNGLISYGDVYYDLAKLLHGILLPHPVVVDGKYKISESENEINIEIELSEKNKEIFKLFKEWCDENGYDFAKIRLLCSLIYMNIAPLHHHPYSRFLFYYGIEMLNNE